jgi:hypothetical protein
VSIKSAKFDNNFIIVILPNGLELPWKESLGHPGGLSKTNYDGGGEA